MKVALCYPVPLQDEDTWREFRPSVERFVLSWKYHPPGHCTVYAVLIGEHDPHELKEVLSPLPVEYVQLEGDYVYDTGAAQYLSTQLDREFQISVSTRFHFNAPGSIAIMASAREIHGPGLYGSSCSLEEHLHIRTNFYGLDASVLRDYPFPITEFGYGRVFEVGDQNGRFSLMHWCQVLGLRPRLVYRNGIFDRVKDWFSQGNTFRKGYQTNLLGWDRATDCYALADLETRGKLHRMAYGIPDSACKSG